MVNVSALVHMFMVLELIYSTVMPADSCPIHVMNLMCVNCEFGHGLSAICWWLKHLFVCKLMSFVLHGI